MKRNISLRILFDIIGQLINARGGVQVSYTFHMCHFRTKQFALIWLKICQPKCVTYVRREVHTFVFIIILDLFTRPTKTSSINAISPVIRDSCMHWIIFCFATTTLSITWFIGAGNVVLWGVPFCKEDQHREWLKELISSKRGHCFIFMQIPPATYTFK